MILRNDVTIRLPKYDPSNTAKICTEDTRNMCERWSFGVKAVGSAGHLAQKAAKMSNLIFY